MRVVAGLGNPGKRYEASRHNLGFQVVERVAARLGLGDWKTQFQALVLRGGGAGGPFLLVKPQTFMNLSGEAVRQVMQFYKVPLDDLVVVLDDMDLALGKIRLRDSGSDAGHRGLRSVLSLLGPGIKRVRIGIGRPPGDQSVVGHVLGGSAEEAELLAQAVEQAAELMIQFLETGRFENWSSP
jgi:PTH1 family peptidyl-tRNA hydrolase